MECRGFESHARQLISSRKSDCLGCAVLLCLVRLFDLACFFLSSFSSLIQNMHIKFASETCKSKTRAMLAYMYYVCTVCRYCTFIIMYEV